MYSAIIDIRFKATKPRFNLCDYAAAVAARQADERDKSVIFKNCTPFTKFISRINDADIDNAQDIIIVILILFNLIDYSDNYSKTSGGLRHYLNNHLNNIFTDSESFKSKVKIGKIPDDGNTKDVEIMVPFKQFLENT